MHARCSGCDQRQALAAAVQALEFVEVSAEATRIFRGDAGLHTCGGPDAAAGGSALFDAWQDAHGLRPCHVELAPGAHVYAIGDLHGDVEAAMACLALCPCIVVEVFAEGAWTSGAAPAAPGAAAARWRLRWAAADPSAVVQCGDVLDRLRSGRGNPSDEEAHGGADEDMILFAFNILHTQARLAGAGGHVIRLLGNHELMNVSCRGVNPPV